MADIPRKDYEEDEGASLRKPLYPLPEPQPPPDREEKTPSSGFVTEFSYSHTGQFPDPYTLHGYKRYAPEIVPIIIEETRAEAKHRRDMERLVKQAGTRRSIWGMNWAGAIGVTAILSATYLGMHGAKEVAVAVVGIPTFGYLTAFLTGTYSSRTERIEKEKIRRGHAEPAALDAPEEDEQL